MLSPCIFVFFVFAFGFNHQKNNRMGYPFLSQKGSSSNHHQIIIKSPKLPGQISPLYTFVASRWGPESPCWEPSWCGSSSACAVASRPGLEPIRAPYGGHVWEVDKYSIQHMGSYRYRWLIKHYKASLKKGTSLDIPSYILCGFGLWLINHLLAGCTSKDFIVRWFGTWYGLMISLMDNFKDLWVRHLMWWEKDGNMWFYLWDTWYINDMASIHIGELSRSCRKGKVVPFNMVTLTSMG